MTIQRLPDEMLEHIISFVPPQDIPALMGVCKQWARIIRGPTICTILFQHRCPGLTCDRRTACAKWFKQKQLYENIKARRCTTSSEELSSEYVLLGDQLYRKVNDSIYPTHIFKEFFVAQINCSLYFFNREGQPLRSYANLRFLGIEEECILCWSYQTREIISIDAQLNQYAKNIYCDGLPVLWGPFLYYHDRSTQKIVQIDRQDLTRRLIICSASLSGGADLYPSGSLLYYCCFDYPRFWTTVIDMQTGTLVGGVSDIGMPIGCDRDRYFTLSDDNVLHAYNKRGGPEQTYRGIRKRPYMGASRVASFNCCTVYTASEGWLVDCSTYIWNSKTGKLLATFPYQFVREDQGKLYFFDKYMRRLIIHNYTQPDPMQV